MPHPSLAAGKVHNQYKVKTCPQLLFVYNLEFDFAPLLKSARSQEEKVAESFGTHSEAPIIKLFLKLSGIN